MPTDRLRSIVPMFGGGTRYVDTLDGIVEFVETHNPTTDEMVGWHRGTFPNVSSRDSIMRRVSYLQQVGFLHQEKMIGGCLGRLAVSMSKISARKPCFGLCVRGTSGFEVCCMRCLRLR